MREQTMSHDVLIDFNAIHDGVARTLRKFAAPGVDLTPGTRVTVGDGEGTTATATIHAVDANDLVTLHVDASTVVSRPGSARLTS